MSKEEASLLFTAYIDARGPEEEYTFRTVENELQTEVHAPPHDPKFLKITKLMYKIGLIAETNIRAKNVGKKVKMFAEFTGTSISEYAQTY